MTRSERWLAMIQTLRIRRRDRRIAPLTLNYPQQKIWNVIAPMIDRGEPIRVIILKARRQGVSTLAEAILTAFCAESDHVNALVTAHDKKPAAKIWGIAKRYVTTSKFLKAVTTIGKDASGSDIIRFGDSTLEVSTAGSPEKERGTDLTAWHGSEVAQYPFASIMTATMQALPDDPSVFSIAILESTANGKVGKGRLFYKEWLRAMRSESEWTPIFIAWHEHPEYRVPGADRIDDATPEEQALRLRFELTDEQLAWRRRKIARDLEGDTDKFRVEYPSYAEEAFVQSGLPFFRPAQLLPLEGDLCKGTRYTIDTEGKLTPEPKGYLEIWKMPEPGRRYIVGSDSAMGLDDEIDDEDGDGRAGSHSRSAGEVIDMETLEQVAEYDAPSAPHIMARHLCGIGRLYHNALLAPEVQSNGGGGGRELLVYLHELAYWNIHQASQNQDRVQPKPKIRLGWETSSRSRPRMLARIREVVMEQSSVIHSRRLFDQLSSFGENDAGRKVALAGHDDLLFAFGIALMSRSENYFKRPASQPASAPSINWKSLGIHVIGAGLQMNGAEFIQRQIAKSSRREHGRTFLEM